MLVVPLVGVLLAVGAIVAVYRLQDRVTRAHQAQLQLADAKNTLTEAHVLPWNLSKSSGAVARLELTLAEQGIVDTLGSVEHTYPNAALRRRAVPLQKDFAVLAEIERYTARHGNSAGATPLAAREFASLGAVLAVLDAAGSGYARDAQTAQREATIGSAAAILLLLAAFAFFHRRSVHTTDRLRRALVSAEEARQSLQAALSELHLVQEERLELLTRTVEISEEERRRIAADLHDGPIQRLTVIALTVDLLVSRLSRGEPDVEGLAQQVRDQLAAEMASLRRLMAELRPPVLDERGLAAAIAAGATDVLPPETTCTVTDRTEAVRFVSDVETVAHRISREALVNVQKHAHATRVEVDLDHVGDNLQVRIADDGIGFDSEAIDPGADHFGLRSMRERVESLAGELRIVSRPGAGTRLEATLPWRPQPATGSPPEGRRAAA